MQWNNTTERYGAAPRLLHWLIALLVIGALILIETRGYAPRGSALRRAMREWHQQVALAAFVLLWLRLYFRSRNRPPAIVPPPPRWQHQIAGALHALFYVLLIVLPILGIMIVQSDNRTVALLGLELPRFIVPDRDLTHQLERIHRWIGNVMIGAIGLHVAAALWHQFVVRDNTLRRML